MRVRPGLFGKTTNGKLCMVLTRSPFIKDVLYKCVFINKNRSFGDAFHVKPDGTHSKGMAEYTIIEIVPPSS